MSVAMNLWAVSALKVLLDVVRFTPKEITVANESIQQLIYRKLVYRKDCRGRALLGDITELALLKYDRLLPTRNLPDVSAFERLPVPSVVVFWRMRKYDRVTHDCPLITDVPYDLYDAWVVDMLHGWALGGLGALIGLIFKFCLQSKVFNPTVPFMDPKDEERLALLAIKVLLQNYYKEKRQDPHFKRTGTEAGSLV